MGVSIETEWGGGGGGEGGNFTSLPQLNSEQFSGLLFSFWRVIFSFITLTTLTFTKTNIV